MQTLSSQRIRHLRSKVFRFYRRHGRHDLPFRLTKNPYRIAVSEVMLQQTQVERVLPFYSRWIATWPDWHSLSRAPIQEVLSHWSGLGYNRRALFLRRMAQVIVRSHHNRMPHTIHELEALPGIGPYTARAILIFAYNKNVVTVDTNIRRVFIHELHLDPNSSMNTIWGIAERALPKGRSRDWHNALMDYAALRLPHTPHIKPLHTQSTFKGSLRQLRGEIVRQLTEKKRVSFTTVAHRCAADVERVRQAADTLAREGIITQSKHFMSLVEKEA